jgi:hypothetical protein
MTVNGAAHFFGIMRAIGTLQLMLVTAMRRHSPLLSRKCPLNFTQRIAALLHRSLLLATSSHFTGEPMGNGGVYEG